MYSILTIFVAKGQNPPLQTCKLDKKLHEVYSVMTFNEQYIIIAGDTTDQLIRIIDIKNEIFRISDIKKPSKANCRVTMCGNKYLEDIITTGYIKNKCHIKNYPKDIIKLIESWYSFEMMHLMDLRTTKHWRINVDDILRIKSI